MLLFKVNFFYTVVDHIPVLKLEIASQLFRSKDLCRLMYFATMNDIHLTKTPDFDIAREISLDEDGARRLTQIKALAFGPAGKPSSNLSFAPM